MPTKRTCYFILVYLALMSALLLSLCSFSKEEPLAEEAASAVNGKTLLLLGIDDSSYSSDVILLAHVDSDGKYLKMMQIPRDTYTANGKLNAVFPSACTVALQEGNSREEAFAQGARALGTFLCRNLGISVDYHAVLTLADFRGLVDSIGGVSVTLPRDLDYEDPAQGLSIHLKAGTQLLDGQKAEGFVRCRNAYVNADYGRMDAQKLFMTAFFQKLKYQTSLPALFSFIGKAHSAIQTDVTLKEALSLGKTVLFAKGEALLFATVKGEAMKEAGKWYEVIPRDTLEKASHWLEGHFPEETAKNTFGGKGNALALYEKEPVSPFAPHSAKELETDA